MDRKADGRTNRQTYKHGHAYTHTYTKIDIPQTVKHSYGQKGRRKDKQTDIVTKRQPDRQIDLFVCCGLTSLLNI